MSKLILFVCTGNTCRSPMAEHYFNNKAGAAFTAASRGIYTESGGSMAQNARQVLLDNNIIADILHEPTQIDGQIMDQAALVYGVTESHANILRENFPDHAGKIKAMPENIGDPYGAGPEIYAACFERIRAAVDAIIKELVCAK